MKGKKLLAAALAAAMLLSVAGCGGKEPATEESPAEEKNSVEESTEGSSEESTEQSETESSASEAGGFYVSEEEGGKTSDPFTIWVGWTSECPDDTRVQQVMREKLGMDYKVEFMQSGDVLTTINLALSSGAEIPDVILMWNNQEAADALIGADRVMNLNDIFESDMVPNISGIDERIKDFIRDKNGDMWYIPGWYAQEYDEPWGGWTTDAWWFRTDLMEAANVTEDDLKTIEGVEEALRKFAQLKDENGNAIIPLSFYQSGSQERIIVAAFGADTAAGVSQMPAVMKNGEDFVFLYDNPQYKAAYQWMNKMYREGLIDMEVTTMQAERYKEKIRNGQIAAFTSDFWSGSPFNEGYEEDCPSFKFAPFQSPAVEGVSKGYTSYVNPNPAAMVFINKDTEHLNAVLHFLDWCNEPEPIRQQEVNEGPEGVNWWRTEGSKWTFEESYMEERNSGDQARVDACTPQLYELSSYSNSWYPWFEQDVTALMPAQVLHQKYCAYIGSELVNHRSITDMDQVKLGTGTALNDNLENLNAVVGEYTAKMIMAESDEKFESVYETFLEQLEMRAEWSKIKEEWMQAYQEQFGN